MIVHKAVVVDEELINVSELTKLISNYCLDKNSIVEALPVESLILEINIVNPDVIYVDIKPLILEQIIDAVSKVVNSMKVDELLVNPSIPLVVQNLSVSNKEYVAISTLEDILFVKMVDIMFCKSDGRYTKFYTENGDMFMSSKNIGEYEEKILNNGKFYRIHNSYIVNMSFVKRIIKSDGSSCELHNGTIIPISKRKIEAFSRYIGIK